MELEGTFDFERPPTRRWVPIVGVVVPVAIAVFVAGWFVRAFIAPPTIAIPSPSMLAAAPAQVQITPRSQTPAATPRPLSQGAAPASSVLPSEVTVQSPTMSMLTSLSAAPPAAAPMPSAVTPATPPQGARQPATTAYANSAPDFPPAALEPGEPISGPIPLPPPRQPNVTVAHALIGPVPLPRPRPVETTPTPTPDVQIFDRHSVQ